MQRLISTAICIILVICFYYFEATSAVHFKERNNIPTMHPEDPENVSKRFNLSKKLLKQTTKKYTRSRTMTKKEETTELSKEEAVQNRTSVQLKKLHDMKSVIQDIIRNIATNKEQMKLLEKLNDNKKQYKNDGRVMQEVSSADKETLKYLDTNYTNKDNKSLSPPVSGRNSIQAKPFKKSITGKYNRESTDNPAHPTASESYVRLISADEETEKPTNREVSSINNYSPTVFEEEDDETLGKRRIILHQKGNINQNKRNEVKTDFDNAWVKLNYERKNTKNEEKRHSKEA